MGRSKFPGKPSRSVMKDRIRVLNKNETDRKLKSKRNSDDCPSCNNIVYSNTITKKKNQFFNSDTGNVDQVQFNPGRISSTSFEQETTNGRFEDNNDDKIKHIKKNCSIDLLEQNQEKTMSFTENVTLKPSLTCVGNMKPFGTEKNNHLKKKCVTFKNILETSDDVLISRSIHNPLNEGPLVSIMKKDCIKTQRYMPRKDKIVRPSRLTKILKNNENIDKTKFLSFRSVHLPMSHEYINQLDEHDDCYTPACKIFLTEEEGEKIEDFESCKKLLSQKRYLMDKWNMKKLEPHKEKLETEDENASTDVHQQPSKKKDSSAHSQIILRQPRLIFETQDYISEKSKQIISNDITEPNFSATKMCNNSVCGVCSTAVNYKNIRRSRKYGITACEFCRTFICKITKNTVVASPNSSKAIQCIKGEGKCVITSLSKSNFKSFKQIDEERCSACWLKKCITSFHFPSGHKLRLSSLISETNGKDVQYNNKSQEAFHFKDAINLLSEKYYMDSQENLFSWKQTISANGVNEYAKSHQEQTAFNNNFIEDLVNGNTTTELYTKAICSDGASTRVNLLLNKNSGEKPNKSIELPASSIITSAYPKRQKIAFKGPRVKHVCRSASIALGQQMATFSNNSDGTLQLLHCISEIKDGSFNNDLSQQTVTEVKQMQIQPEKQVKCVKNTDDSSFMKALEINRPSLECVLKVNQENKKVARDGTPDLNTVKSNHKNVPHKCGGSKSLFTATYGSKSSASKRNLIRLKNVPQRENKSKMISIEFWDTYVPAEVNQTGFGLILTKPTSVLALCFLCGCMDLNDLLFCVCCCEPYHSYCIQEAYTDEGELVDKIETSSKFSNQLNWMCPRCTVCYTCNMSSGAKIKCQKCKKNYHNTCMGTSKGLLGADRPLICRSCLKCQFCSTTKVSKYIGNQPTCIKCLMQRRTVSTCSKCQKCIDSVLEMIILECGVCNELIHAKCEGLTEEQTNLLSSISGNIKFVCTKCSLSNNKSKTLAKQWREAVYKELKSRLLQVLKLLSKSRLSDILKKTIKNNCRCGFDKIIKDYHIKEDSNGCYKYKLNNINGSEFQSKCSCSESEISLQTNNYLCLLDIKKKIVNGEYLSLFDFNADMNDVITPLKNDELILTYKEIISEQFSWFQNDTKICTDALEEDMIDSCNYTFQNEGIIAEDQNLSPKLSIPCSQAKLFTSLKQNIDKRICIFCKDGDGEMLQESRLLYYGFDSWVHVNCALWSMDVYEEFDGSLQNVHNVFIRGKLIRCTVCGNSGATIKCNVKACSNYFHFQCARKNKCLFLHETSMFCSLHSKGHEISTNNISKGVQDCSRPLHIECNKIHTKYVEPFKVQFILGSLSVIQLGTIYLPFSDTSEAIVPINFICTRLYWSSKEPWKVIKYRVRTSIQNSSITCSNEEDRNFTVDHSKNKPLVESDLSQISFWHNTLIPDEGNDASLNNEHNCLNNLRFSRNIDYRNETTLDASIEEEPQNNSDLLPPEIEEAIFEDLPNDILDGISMLDIFPKLMIHEDLEDIEGKLEKINANTENTASQQSNNYLLSTSLQKQDSKSDTLKRELQNSDSEFLVKNLDEYRSQQRSSCVTWAIENRRFTKDIFDPNFSERRARNLNPLRFEERVGDGRLNAKNSVSSEENKNLTQFMRNNIKLMQLDGADDHVAGYLSTQMKNTSSKSPVKCDRCHCTYRTFDSFQRHFVNCEQISTSESETDTSSQSPDSENSRIVVSDELNKDRHQLYQSQFLRNQNVLTNVKRSNNFNTFSAESIIPQNIGNTACLYVHIDKAGYSNIGGVNVNTLKNSKCTMKEKINYNKTNINNSEKKSEQCKVIPKIKEVTVATPIQSNTKANDSQDKNNCLQILNQNFIFGDQYSQKEQQHQQQQQFIIIQQSAGNSQPMLIPNAVPPMHQNIFPVVLSNNSVQYASVPAYSNSLMPTPIWHSDCNLMLSSGLQILPLPSLQLASPSSQLIGSFNLPQTMQLGSNQVLVGGTSTLDLMPNVNQLLLAPQPVFYGLETIVQNTVMSSQQFVSTAVQGVLNQNASFSATTTQVFQSSKFEPVSDASKSYVVLNNVDGSTLVVPQTNILPGFLNTNSSHEFQSGYNADFGSLNVQNPQAFIQQSEPSKIFPLIQTLPEIASTPVKAPTNKLEESMRFEASSNIVSSPMHIIQSAPLVENGLQSQSENLFSQKWLGNRTPMQKVKNCSTTVNDHNSSYEKYSDYFEVKNTGPVIMETSLKHKVEITPRSIKRKKSSATFAQIGLKLMYKNILQKELKSNHSQDVFLEKPNSKTNKYCELSRESSLNNTLVPITSSIKKINDTHSHVKSEFQKSKDLYEIRKSNESNSNNSLPSIVSRLESRKSANLGSIKLPFKTQSFGSSLHNVPTNIVVPIMQAKQIKNITSRPTNRVLPMQSIHKLADTSKPKNSIQNMYFIKENVQSSTPVEAKILKAIATAKKKFECIKQLIDVSEAEKNPDTADCTGQHVALRDNLSTNKTTDNNNTSCFRKPDKNILDNQNPVVEIVNSPIPIKKKKKMGFDNPEMKENYDSQNPGQKEKNSSTYNSVDPDPSCSNNNFSANKTNIGIEKCIKGFMFEKENQYRDVSNVKLSNQSDQENIIFQNDLENFNKTSTSVLTKMPKQFEMNQQTNASFASSKSFKVETIKKSTEPYLIFEIQSEDGFSYKSQSISDVWEKAFEAVQISRRAHGLPSYPIESFADICGIQILGLKTNALKYLIEQLPGAEKCQRYTPKYHQNESISVSNVCTKHEVGLVTKNFAAARCEAFEKRSAYDMFSWLASKHRKQPKQIFVQPSDTELIARRCTANLPMAMKYRTLKETSKLNVGVFRSLIHGRGLFCIKDMEAGEMVIEYAGELIRSTLADKRERFYDNKGIGCYMFKIDENFVVDATMRGNAARFINHSCEPNCYSKVVDILGHKHIIIFSLRRIVQGEELTYDYKFPFEDIKIHCYCSSKKCRKYLN